MDYQHPEDTRLQTVAIVGATGAVGVELLRCLEQRNYPVGTLRLLASPRSAGKTMLFRGQPVTIEATTRQAFEGVDVALFAAGATVSREFVPIALGHGCRVVDNSSAYRMNLDIPLVVPEVNGDLLAANTPLVANPNCVAAIAVMALAPLHAQAPIVRLIGATYQAASGAGAAAMEELELSTAAYLKGEAYAPKVLPHPYAFNLFSHNAEVDVESGYNGEETKAMEEIRKIMRTPDLRASFTCVRVPVLRAHSMALTVEFDRPVSAAQAVQWLEAAPGLRLVNNPAANHYPMPNEASGQGDVLVGRVRQDLSDPSGRTVSLFVAGDQLLKGAALNAVQIAEAMNFAAVG